jgi:hypothetical protein
MGYVDTHNRYRQNILGLYKLWRTKKWQVRVILENFGMALLDSFLLAQKFVPRWQNEDDSDGIFWKYVVTLLPQIAASNDGGPTRSSYKCEQILIGKTKVENGKNAGRVIAKQQRCVYSIQTKKQRKKNDEDTSSSDNRTPKEQGERPIPAFVIAKLSRARRGWLVLATTLERAHNF